MVRVVRVVRVCEGEKGNCKRASQEEHNGANFSFIAPSSEE